MEVDTEKTDKALILKLIGRLDAQTSEHCKTQLDENLKDNTLVPILDFSGTQYISSMGLRVIINAGQEFRKQETTVRIICPPGPVNEILKTAGFNLIFSIFESREAALEDVEGS